MSEEFPKGGYNQPSYFRILNLHDLARPQRANTSKFNCYIFNLFRKKVLLEHPNKEIGPSFFVRALEKI